MERELSKLSMKLEILEATIDMLYNCGCIGHKASKGIRVGNGGRYRNCIDRKSSLGS